MSRVSPAKAAAALAVLALAVLAYWTFARNTDEPSSAASASRPAAAPPEAPGVIYGRVTTYGGATFEGPIRWGGGEEAFWDHAFNGVKAENEWATFVPDDERTTEPRTLEYLGLEVPFGTRPVDLSRPFMARFGDIARIEALGEGVGTLMRDGVAYDPTVRVTLKSGTVVDLDRNASSDFDDGVRIWDRSRGVVDLGPRQIRTIEFLAREASGDAAADSASGGRLYGTVQTASGSFTGFLQWDREESLGSDRLVGTAASGEMAVAFRGIRSIAREADGTARVTLRDGRDLALSGNRKVGPGNRGVYVEDARFGRVLVSWDAFQRVDIGEPARGLAYADFAPGAPLAGTVTTRDGRQLSGRLVYDLDESQTTETLDAPASGVDYTIPFARIASIAPPEASGAVRVVLRNGETLDLEPSGDLGAGNGGVLVFLEGSETPEYVRWVEVERIEFDRVAEVRAPEADEGAA